MWLFSFFNKEKYLNTTNEIKSTMTAYMAQYASDNPDEMGDAAYIFSNAIKMVESSTPKDIARYVKQQRISPQEAALNILQNCAMVEISPCPVTELISRNYDDVAYDLYNAINDEKLQKRFISKQQHEDNKLLAIKIKSASFF